MVNITMTEGSTMQPTRQEFLADMQPFPLVAANIIDEDSNCFVCFKDFADEAKAGSEEQERAVLLHDTHIIGEQCAREWLAGANTCPKCRHVLFQADAKDNAEEMTMEEVEARIVAANGFHQAELDDLIGQVDLLLARNSRLRSEIPDDREVMRLYFKLRDCCRAMRFNNLAHAMNSDWGLTIRRLEERMARIQGLRVKFDKYHPGVQNFNITEANEYDSTSEDWINQQIQDCAAGKDMLVTLDFEMDIKSAFYQMVWLRDFDEAFDEETHECVDAAGHPVATKVIRLIMNGVMRRHRNETMTISRLSEILRVEVGDFDDKELMETMPLGFADWFKSMICNFVRYAIVLNDEEPGSPYRVGLGYGYRGEA